MDDNVLELFDGVKNVNFTEFAYHEVIEEVIIKGSRVKVVTFFSSLIEIQKFTLYNITNLIDWINEKATPYC